MNKLNYLNKITRLPQNPQEQSPKQRLKKKEEEISYIKKTNGFIGSTILALLLVKGVSKIDKKIGQLN